MMMNDPLGDMLTRIRNAQTRGRSSVLSPASKLRVRVLEVLQREGYIRGWSEIEKDGVRELDIELKYYDGAPVISEIRRVSKPGRRVYSSVGDLRLCATVSASRSCRRRRASCRTTTPVRKTSAAKSSARSRKGPKGHEHVADWKTQRRRPERG
jgi:small subunit ribosomal protein S8